MYDTYIYDEHPADQRHLRDLLVQYQIRSNVEADITACTLQTNRRSGRSRRCT